MLRFPLPYAVALSVCAAAAAQSPLGFMNRTDTSFTSRGSAMVPNTNPSVSILRIDKESYAGWGVNPASPGMREILGVNCFIQDQVGTTPETFGIVAYTEDTASANYPDVANPVGMMGGIPTPASTAAAAVAWGLTINFTTPMLAPASGDVFLGVELPQPTTGTWPTDGLSCHALYYVMVTSGLYDLPGASHPVGQPEEGNGLWYVSTFAAGPQYTTTPRQWKIEPIVAGAAGTAGAITNQTTSSPLSIVAPGTASMASGLHPDAQNPPLNAGRIDDITSRWFMTGMPDNSPVFFLASFNPFGPEIPLSAFVGGTGVACIDTTAFFQVGFRLTTAGEAFFTWSLSPTARMGIAGIGLVHQSIGLDTVTNLAHANGCTRQIL